MAASAGEVAELRSEVGVAEHGRRPHQRRRRQRRRHGDGVGPQQCGAVPLPPQPSGNQPSGDREYDELINAREAARVLGRSVSWVQQRARETPLKYCLVRSLGRGLLFSRRKIDRLIAHEAGQNPNDLTQGLRGVNSGRRPRRKGNADPPSTSIPSGESGGG